MNWYEICIHLSYKISYLESVKSRCCQLREIPLYYLTVDCMMQTDTNEMCRCFKDSKSGILQVADTALVL